jgi:hypothetical protein
MSSLTIDQIKNICTDFVNDPDTTIGMECFWPDYLVKEVSLDFTPEQVIQTLNVTTTEYAIPVHVHHNRYGDMVVYVAISQNGGIKISTKEWLLDENKYREALSKSK